MGSAPVFDQFPARGKTPSALASQSFPGFWRSAARTPASRSQSRRATSCATPGYSVFLHNTMRSKEKASFPCLWAALWSRNRYTYSFSAGGFLPQATVPRTSGVPLLGEWMSHLSTQITCATNCATPGYSVFLHDTMRRKKKQVFRVCGGAVVKPDFAGIFQLKNFRRKLLSQGLPGFHFRGMDRPSILPKQARYQLRYTRIFRCAIIIHDFFGIGKRIPVANHFTSLLELCIMYPILRFVRNCPMRMRKKPNLGPRMEACDRVWVRDPPPSRATGRT